MQTTDGIENDAESAKFPVLSSSLVAIPPPCRSLRAQENATVSFRDRAKSSPGTRIFDIVWHIACTNKTPSTSRYPTCDGISEKSDSLARFVLMVTRKGTTLNLPPTTEEACQLGAQYGALAS